MKRSGLPAGSAEPAGYARAPGAQAVGLCADRAVPHCLDLVHLWTDRHRRCRARQDHRERAHQGDPAAGGECGQAGVGAGRGPCRGGSAAGRARSHDRECGQDQHRRAVEIDAVRGAAHARVAAGAELAGLGPYPGAGQEGSGRLDGCRYHCNAGPAERRVERHHGQARQGSVRDQPPASRDRDRARDGQQAGDDGADRQAKRGRLPSAGQPGLHVEPREPGPLEGAHRAGAGSGNATRQAGRSQCHAKGK